MSKMQALGVKRAVLAVEAHWHGQIAEGLIVAGRVYFGKLDDGDSEILDKAARKRIEQSGLGAELDREAIIAVQLHASGPFRFDSREEPGYYEGQLVGVDVEFFAYPWIGRSEPLILEPMRSPRALEGAAARADVAALQGAFATGPHDQNELNRAMIAAALAPFDNRAVFIALLNAGAQLEPARPFVSPLFNALGTPCNVEDLLALGADPNVPDERGRTPLAAAREGGYAASAKLLQLAGGHL
ncbi:MAG: hypothetical protein ACRD1L_13920 [Terriglobales bacterium]